MQHTGVNSLVTCYIEPWLAKLGQLLTKLPVDSCVYQLICSPLGLFTNKSIYRLLIQVPVSHVKESHRKQQDHNVTLNVVQLLNY